MHYALARTKIHVVTRKPGGGKRAKKKGKNSGERRGQGERNLERECPVALMANDKRFHPARCARLLRLGLVGWLVLAKFRREWPGGGEKHAEVKKKG